MNSRMALVLTALAVVSAMAALMGRGVAPSSVVGSGHLRLGVNMHPMQSVYDPPSIRRHVELADGVGASVVRIDIHWSWMEPDGPGEERWNPEQVAWLEAFLVEARARDLDVLATVMTAPCWASTDPAKDCSRHDYDWRYGPAFASDFASFLTAVVRRYGGDIGYWEIWNEPNLPGWWRPVPDPAAYTELVRAGYSAVKSVDPTAVVLAGSLGPFDGDDRVRTTSIQYLEAMYRAGLSDHFDALAIHPYTDGRRPNDPLPDWPTYGYGTFVEGAREVMVRNGDGDKPAYSDENDRRFRSMAIRGRQSRWTDTGYSGVIDMASLARVFRWDSPLSWMRKALWTRRSTMVSARVESPSRACHCSMGIWVARRVACRP